MLCVTPRRTEFARLYATTTIKRVTRRRESKWAYAFFAIPAVTFGYVMRRSPSWASHCMRVHRLYPPSLHIQPTKGMLWPSKARALASILMHASGAEGLCISAGKHTITFTRSLGTWQVQRLGEKRDLLDKVMARTVGNPMPLPARCAGLCCL